MNRIKTKDVRKKRIDTIYPEYLENKVFSFKIVSIKKETNLRKMVSLHLGLHIIGRKANAVNSTNIDVNYFHEKRTA